MTKFFFITATRRKRSRARDGSSWPLGGAAIIAGSDVRAKISTKSITGFTTRRSFSRQECARGRRGRQRAGMRHRAGRLGREGDGKLSQAGVCASQTGECRKTENAGARSESGRAGGATELGAGDDRVHERNDEERAARLGHAGDGHDCYADRSGQGDAEAGRRQRDCSAQRRRLFHDRSRSPARFLPAQWAACARGLAAHHLDQLSSLRSLLRRALSLEEQSPAGIPGPALGESSACLSLQRPESDRRSWRQNRGVVKPRDQPPLHASSVASGIPPSITRSLIAPAC